MHYCCLTWKVDDTLKFHTVTVAVSLNDSKWSFHRWTIYIATQTIVFVTIGPPEANVHLYRPKNMLLFTYLKLFDIYICQLVWTDYIALFIHKETQDTFNSVFHRVPLVLQGLQFLTTLPYSNFSNSVVRPLD